MDGTFLEVKEARFYDKLVITSDYVVNKGEVWRLVSALVCSEDFS